MSKTQLTHRENTSSLVGSHKKPVAGSQSFQHKHPEQLVDLLEMELMTSDVLYQIKWK